MIAVPRKMRVPRPAAVRIRRHKPHSLATSPTPTYAGGLGDRMSLARIYRAVLGLLLLMLPSAASAGDILSCGLVPGWEQSGKARSFDTETLYEYMDGNSEGYFIYGFVKMQGITCKQGENQFIIDISEMTDPDAAYGIYLANRDPNSPFANIGMGGQILPRKATFAKDKYYVEISASPDRDHSAGLEAFFKEIEKRIEGRSTPPETLSWFPQENRVSVRMVPQSVLGMRILKRGYLAQYNEGKAFIVAEASPDSAAAVMKKLQARFGETSPAAIADEAFQFQDQYLGGLCVFRKGRYLAGYSNATTSDAAAKLASGLATRLP